MPSVPTWEIDCVVYHKQLMREVSAGEERNGVIWEPLGANPRGLGDGFTGTRPGSQLK